MTQGPAPEAVVRGRHVLAAMLVFFAAVIGVNVAFTIVAVRSFPGEDERRSYLQGLHYNDVLAERERARALGWQASAALQEDRGAATLSIVLADAAGAPVGNASVAATLRRPASDREDRTLVLREAGEGRYVAAVGALGPGAWKLKAVVERGEQRLRFERRLEWRSTR